MSKDYLAVGNHLINPRLIAYAISEGEQLRLVFGASPAGSSTELRLDGEEAKEVLRWLRWNSEFLTRAGVFGAVGVATEVVADEVFHDPAGGPYLRLSSGWREVEVRASEVGHGLLGRVGGPG